MKCLVIENRDFGGLWFGQVLSQAGTRLYQLSVTWWIVSSGRANAGTVAAIFLVMAALPSVLFVRRIGRLLDTFRTKNLLLVADGLNAVVVGLTAVAIVHWPQLRVEWLYLAGFLVASLQAITDPGFGKSVCQLVEPERVGEATAFQTSALSFGFFVGAGLVGVLLPLVGVAGAVAFNALTYFVSFLCIAAARFRFAPPPGGGGTAPSTEGAWQLLDAYPRFKKLLVGMGIINFFTVPTFVILPIYVERALHADAAAFGRIESGIWLGILVGTFLAHRLRITESAERLGAICCAILGVGLFAPGLIIDERFFFAMTFLQGAAFAFIPVRFVGLFQQGIPDAMKGRFFALMSAMFAATPPLSQLAAGLLADRLPITALCLLQGAGSLLVSAFFLAPNAFGAELARQETLA